MRYEELKDAIQDAIKSVSMAGENVLDNVLSNYDGFADDDIIDVDEVNDYIRDEIDGYFTYYSDAWDYLMDSDITDFTEAIDYAGCKDVCSIAYYYLEDEINQNLVLVD